MPVTLKNLSSHPARGRANSLAGTCLSILFLSVQALFVSGLWAQETRAAPIGVAWRVQGAWRLQGSKAPVLIGDAIPPGSLLQPDNGSTTDSIVILLPDGQRILYECFSRQECERGFRVPALYRKPTPFALDMMARIHAALVRENKDSPAGLRKEPVIPQDEAVAELGPGGRVHVSGLAAALPNGSYTYNLQSASSEHTDRLSRTLEKTGPLVTFAVPSSGLYDVTILDSLRRPRIDLLLAALKPGQQAAILGSFNYAHELLENWNTHYQGWPTHEFQRAYLESLVLDIKPLNTGLAWSAANGVQIPDVTGEPVFSPRPGLFDGDTAVTLQCATPGAVIRYTIDNSQPQSGSEIYRAPIMVKGTELTIKAFASAANKRDSPVVAGIFRIGQQ